MRVRIAAAAVVLLLLATAGIYFYGLERSPIYLTPDEVLIALDAHSVATTGRDLQNRLLPLYFQIGTRSWYQPMLIYALALWLKLVHVSESTIRIPTACIGVVDVGLIYLLAKRLFASRWLGALAAVLLAITPAHLIHSRFAMDYLWPLPFIVAWLIGLLAYLERGDRRMLFASTISLGFGFYSYIAAVLMMPLYLALTCVVLVAAKRGARDMAIAVAGFLLPVSLLFVPWWLMHSAAYGDTVARYAFYDSTHLDVLQGLREFFSYARITRLMSLYWSYFDPAFLFLDAAAPRVFSTRASGVFLIPLAVFVPLGLYSTIRGGATAIDFVLWAGFLSAPVAAVLVDENGSINRALELLPFGVLLAVAGVRQMWSWPRFDAARRMLATAAAVGITVGLGYVVWTTITQGRISRSSLPLLAASGALAAVALISRRVNGWRIVVAALLAIVPLQFAFFYADYLTDYRARSADAFYWNIRGGLEAIIERDQRDRFPVIYLSGDIPYVDVYWQLYTLKHDRRELLAKTVQFDPTQFDAAAVPRGAAVLMRYLDPRAATLQTTGELRRLDVVTEPGGYPTFVVLQR